VNEGELVAAYGGPAIIVDSPAKSSLPGYRVCLGVGRGCDTLIPDPRRYCRFCLGTMAGMGRAPAEPGPVVRLVGGG
jgi:hypothetical protein